MWQDMPVNDSWSESVGSGVNSPTGSHHPSEVQKIQKSLFFQRMKFLGCDLL